MQSLPDLELQLSPPRIVEFPTDSRASTGAEAEGPLHPWGNRAEDGRQQRDDRQTWPSPGHEAGDRNTEEDDSRHVRS